MRYSTDITIPPDTSKEEPFIQPVRLDVGTLTNVKIRFRAGCHYRVEIAVFDSLEMIVPATGGDWIYGNNEIIEIPVNRELTYVPYELYIYGCSPGSEFGHTLTVWFDLIEAVKKGGDNFLMQLLGIGG